MSVMPRQLNFLAMALGLWVVLVLLVATQFVLIGSFSWVEELKKGGIIGALCGMSTSRLAGRVTEFKPVVSTGSILLAFAVSSAIGIFFGFYPARKAAALNPIDALRYE
jgi:ABC-type lipoprotein release transport system permease subunit